MGVFVPSPECSANMVFEDGLAINTKSNLNVYQRIEEKDLDLSKYHINNN
jgi:hypothetical protein